MPKSKIVIVLGRRRILITRRAGLFMSVLAKRFEDPALGELVLAHDALGVDPKEDVHAVPGPLRYLRRVDAAIEPRGQASVPEIVRAPGERRGLLRGGEGYLAGLIQARR